MDVRPYKFLDLERSFFLPDGLDAASVWWLLTFRTTRELVNVGICDKIFDIDISSFLKLWPSTTTNDQRLKLLRCVKMLVCCDLHRSVTNQYDEFLDVLISALCVESLVKPATELINAFTTQNQPELARCVKSVGKIPRNHYYACTIWEHLEYDKQCMEAVQKHIFAN